jgi:hypothetical protein
MKIGPVADAFPTAWLTCAAAIDGGLTATLVYVLLKDRKYNSHTKRLLYEIAGLTLETGTLAKQFYSHTRNTRTDVSARNSPADTHHWSGTLCFMAHVENTDERILVLYRVCCCSLAANGTSDICTAGSLQSAMR